MPGYGYYLERFYISCPEMAVMLVARYWVKGYIIKLPHSNEFNCFACVGEVDLNERAI